MSINNDLKSYEKKLRMKALTSYDQDGLADLIFGWILINIGLYLQFKWIWLYFASILPIMLVFPLLKQKITIPRIGFVKFRTRRTRVMWAFGIVGGLFLLAAVVVGIFFETSPNYIGAIELGIIGIALIMVVIAGFNRMVGYCIFVPIFIIAVLSSRFLTSTTVFIVGAGVLLWGAWLLIRFLRMYPIMDEEESDVSA